jgi:hypothetical protein
MTNPEPVVDSRFRPTWTRRLIIYVAMVGLVIAVILMMPVILPVVWAAHIRYVYRLRSCSERFHCLGCRHVLGPEALRLADADWAKQMADMRTKHPGERFRVLRRFHAICAQCGWRYRFVEKARRFEAIAV